MLILEIAAAIWVGSWALKMIDTVGCLIAQAILLHRQRH